MSSPVGVDNHAGIYHDRVHGGRVLAGALAPLVTPETLVLGIPRGGLPVAAAAADQLGLELDFLVARKLGAPGHRELALGAITVDGSTFINEELVDELAISDPYLRAVTSVQQGEALRQEERLREGRARPVITGRRIIVVDDGLATGATMRAALRSLRRQGAAMCIAAAPVGARDTCRRLADDADAVVCPEQRLVFGAVSLFYEHFGQVSDEEMGSLLRERRPAGAQQMRGS